MVNNSRSGFTHVLFLLVGAIFLGGLVIIFANPNLGSDATTAITGDAALVSLPAPSNLKAKRVLAQRIELTWEYGKYGQTGFMIATWQTRKSCDTETFGGDTLTAGANAREKSHSGLDSNIYYCYKIRAYSGSGANRVYSAYSNIATDAPVPTPTPIVPTPTPTPIVATPTPSPIIPSPSPDLYVVPFYSFPAYKQGDQVLISAKISNARNAYATSSKARLKIRVNASTTDEYNFIPPLQLTSNLSAYGSTTVTWAWTAVAGHHVVEVCADYLNNVQEYNENNNCFSTSLVIYQPDLKGIGHSYSPSSLSAGGYLTPGVIIKNIGNATTTTSYTRLRVDLNYNASGTTVGWDLLPPIRYTPSLNANASTTVAWINLFTPTSSIALPVGPHWFEFCADINNTINESVENNNCSNLFLDVF